MARIVGVDIGRVDYPLVGEFKFFRTPARPTIVVRLTDEDGLEGWGQSVPVETWTYETVESVETTLRHYLAPGVLGAGIRATQRIHERMERAIRPSFSVGSRSPRQRSNLACYDLWGKQVRKPASDLWRVAAQWQQGGSDQAERTVQAPTIAGARALEQARALGYSHFNIKIGPPQRRPMTGTRRPVVRFAPDGFTGPTPNTSYTLDTARSSQPKLPTWASRRSSRRCAKPHARLSVIEAARPAAGADGGGHCVASRGRRIHRARHVRRYSHEGRALWRLVERSRIAKLLTDDGSLLYARPHRSGAVESASAHSSAGPGSILRPRFNGPQYIADRGTTERNFAPVVM